jgi:hypothetical protein
LITPPAIDLTLPDRAAGMIKPVPLGRWAVAGVGLQLLLSVILALLSDGSYHDDGLTHYLYARWAWSTPAYLLDEWGRPGLTVLLFPVGLLGWTAGRLVMALATAFATWLAYRSAVRMSLPGAGCVPWLCLVQPVYLLASYTTFTETAAALYLTAAVWAFLAGRRRLAAAIFSLCFVTRYEMLALLPIWVWAIRCARGHWLAYLLLLWAPLAHNLFGFAVMGRWPFAFLSSGSHPDMYGSGTPLTMLVKSMAAYGPVVAALALGGVFFVPRSGGRWIVPALLLAYLLLHSLIFWLGSYASGGYPRFLITTSPLAAICAAAGLSAMADASRRRRQWCWAVMALALGVLWLGIELEAAARDEAWVFVIAKARWFIRAIFVLTIALIAVVMTRRQLGPAASWKVTLGGAGRALAVLAIVATLLPVAFLLRPHRLTADERVLQAGCDWLAESDYADHEVITTNIWVCHLLGSDRNLIPPDSTTILEGAAAGTVFIWDADYSPTPRFDISRASMEDWAGWRKLWPASPQQWRRFANSGSLWRGDAVKRGDPFVSIFLRE